MKRFIAAAKTLCLVVVTLSFLFFIGCDQLAHKTLGKGKAPQTGEMSKEELRMALDDFKEYTVSAIKQTCDKLDALMPTTKIQKINLLHRSRMKQAFYTMVEQKDPIIAFVETWGLCIRYTDYLRDGEGSSIYGENQGIAVEGAVEIQDEIERIGKGLFKEDVFNTTRTRLVDFAKRNPIKGTFSNTIAYATLVEPGKPNPFAQIIGIPMTPFKAMEGVDRTATSIYGVQGSIERFSDIVEDWPESAKWQLLLLLLEVQDIESVKSFSDNMSKISDSSAKFADAAEKLPERLREQTSILVKEIDSKQANLQATLEKADKTAASLEQAFSKADETLQIMNNTANSINETAKSWESAANATDKTVRTIKDWTNEPPQDNAPPPMTIRDYKDVAQEVTKAAEEMRGLTADIRDFESKALGLIDHITWRLIQLVLLIFVLILLSKFVTRHWINKS